MINKKSAALAKRRGDQKKDPRSVAQRAADEQAAQRQREQERYVRKVSDKYIV